MQRGSEGATCSYRFSMGDESPIADLAEALGFVRGVDPIELSPIAERVDPDALEALLASPGAVSASFEVDGLHVAVRSDGEILVTAPAPEPSFLGDVDGVSNVLLLEEVESDLCREHLSAVPPERTNVIGVLTSRSADDFISGWGPRSPANGVVFEIGGAIRSAAVDATEVGVARFSVEPVSGLGRAGVRVAETLSGWAGDRNDLVVCLDALEDVLVEAGVEDVFMFLEPFLRRVRLADGTAHVHLDPTEVDDRTRYTLEPLFDAVVEVGTDGDRTVRRR